MPLFATLFTSKLRGSDRAVQQLRQNSARDNDWPGRRGAIPGGGGGMVSGIVRSNTRTRMATVEPVDNSDPPEVHSKDLGVLQKRMQKSQADMRSQFADIGSIKDQLFFDDVRLAVGIDEAKAANKGLSRFREEMEGDFELMNHKVLPPLAVASLSSQTIRVRSCPGRLTDSLVSCAHHTGGLDCRIRRGSRRGAR